MLNAPESIMWRPFESGTLVCLHQWRTESVSFRARNCSHRHSFCYPRPNCDHNDVAEDSPKVHLAYLWRRLCAPGCSAVAAPHESFCSRDGDMPSYGV